MGTECRTRRIGSGGHFAYCVWREPSPMTDWMTAQIA